MTFSNTGVASAGTTAVNRVESEAACADRRLPDVASKLLGGAGIAFVVILLSLTVSGPGSIVVKADRPPQYFVDETKLPFDALSGTTTTRLWGVHGGAGYRIEVPENWNGELVLYAHGFRGAGLELTVSNPPIRRYLVEHGYAWAASSYATNGYDVTQGVKDTHDLGTLFNGLVAHPNQVYFTGTSMGGHITGVAIEQYPNAYVGAMPMCGVMGDNKLFDYFVENHLAAQTLAGLPQPFPFPADYATTVVPQLRAAFGGAAPGFPQTLSALGDEVVRRGPESERRSASDVRPRLPLRCHGRQLPPDPGRGVSAKAPAPTSIRSIRSTTTRRLSAEEVALNANILRIDLDPQARHEQGLAGVPAISGNVPDAGAVDAYAR